MIIKNSLKCLTYTGIAIGSISVFPIIGLSGLVVGNIARLYHRTMIDRYETKIHKYEDGEKKNRFQKKQQKYRKLDAQNVDKIKWATLNVIPGYTFYWSLKTAEGRKFVDHTAKYSIKYVRSLFSTKDL